MGILKKMKNAWHDMTVPERINLVIDAICGVGCSMASMRASKKLTENSCFAEKVLVRTAMTGIGLAAADVSSKAVKEYYGEPLADVIERVKAKKAKEEEAAAHE